MSDYKETAQLYNHIGNGGFTFTTFVEDDTQYLSIEMSHMGITHSSRIMLNRHTIESLIDVLTVAKIKQHEITAPDDYLYDLPHSAYENFSGENSGCAEAQSSTVKFDEVSQTETRDRTDEEVASSYLNQAIEALERSTFMSANELLKEAESALLKSLGRAK